MTKEGTRGQLYGSQEYKEIPPLRFAPVEMTKEGCAKSTKPEGSPSFQLAFLLAQAGGARHFQRTGCQHPWGEIMCNP
jgi:hypothetical protein